MSNNNKKKNNLISLQCKHSWCLQLTMHAACTASLRLAALGSHQNMWQVNSRGPSAMMKAKVWTSLPTPMKDRKRTLHSDSTSSSWRSKQGQ